MSENSYLNLDPKYTDEEIDRAIHHLGETQGGIQGFELGQFNVTQELEEMRRLELAAEQPLNIMAAECHAEVRAKGFYDGVDLNDLLHVTARAALTASEVFEMIETLRDPVSKVSEKIPEFAEEEDEWADVFIRHLDYGAARGIDMDGAVAAKRAYNRGRPYRHGKKF